MRNFARIYIRLSLIDYVEVHLKLMKLSDGLVNAPPVCPKLLRKLIIHCSNLRLSVHQATISVFTVNARTIVIQVI